MMMPDGGSLAGAGNPKEKTARGRRTRVRLETSVSQGMRVPEPNAAAKANTLLSNLRRTPMTRGRLDERRRILRASIETTLGAEGIPQRLVERIAFQLVLKSDITALGDQATWRAMGQLLNEEIRRLRNGIGLVDRQIIVALPKLSPKQIEDLLEDLRTADPKIARTILNAALDAADPLSASQRYLSEFHHVADQLKAIDPEIARTVANATFMARVPHRKAMAHLKRFAELTREFQDDVEFARTVAREAFRATDPVKSAQRFIADYDRIVKELTSSGVGTRIARTVAAIASVSADPLPSAYKLLQNFEDVLRFAKRTHPWIARSIALNACRAANPLSMARSYMNNYDTIFRLVSLTDSHNARKVACQVFRSDDPLRWAKRYLAQLQESDAS